MTARAELRIVAAAALLVATSCSQLPSIIPAPPGQSPPTTSTALPALEAEIHELINRHRQASGLSRLTPDRALDALAREHSGRMARGEVPLGHDGFEARFDSARASISISRMAENVTMNSGFPAAVVPQKMVGDWIDSPGHRANLEGDFAISGVGIARSPQGAFFATQLFAR